MKEGGVRVGGGWLQERLIPPPSSPPSEKESSELRVEYTPKTDLVKFLSCPRMSNHTGGV